MKFRVARHTTKLEEIKKFYHEIIGFEILGEFENHSNYDGVFLGLKDQNWHLEFTVSNEPPKHKPDEDDLLVFYPETEGHFNEIIKALKNAGIDSIPSKNPYWNNHGVTVLDPDNFSIVIAKPTK